MKIKNVSPLGDLHVPLLGGVVAAGEAVEVSDDDAGLLLAQPATWAPVDNDAKALEKKIRTAAEGEQPSGPDLAAAPVVGAVADEALTAENEEN